MSEEYPLYPNLHPDGVREFETLIERFKDKLKKAAEEVIGQAYVDLPSYIESDAWTNFRNEMLAGFTNYGNRKLQGEYDFARIREKIFGQFRAEIIADLDQDNLKRIADLEKEISRLREIIDGRPHGRY